MPSAPVTYRCEYIDKKKNVVSMLGSIAKSEMCVILLHVDVKSNCLNVINPYKPEVSMARSFLPRVQMA